MVNWFEVSLKYDFKSDISNFDLDSRFDGSPILITDWTICESVQNCEISKALVAHN
jgi:hypothetical protein